MKERQAKEEALKKKEDLERRIQEYESNAERARESLVSLDT